MRPSTHLTQREIQALLRRPLFTGNEAGDVEVCMRVALCALYVGAVPAMRGATAAQMRVWRKAWKFSSRQLVTLAKMVDNGVRP